MIIGIGHDLTSLDRVKGIIESDIGERFVQRVLTSRELDRARTLAGVRKLEFIAGRFAAKEAVSKAFGCGIGSVLSFQDIEIGRDEYGKPVGTIAEQAWGKLGRSPHRTRVHVTITHERPIASAFVVVEEHE